jgi:ubiquinone/menaquinone biosynthesis C-methylase UbiE
LTISFDRVAHLYDATRGMPEEAAERVADAVVRLSGATPETRFLEPGIGTGRIALPLVRRGYDYTGVDIAPKMLDELRRKLGSAPHRLRLVEADATALPFEDATFDVAISAHVLHLIPHWRRALSEVRRVLEPGGLLLYCHQEFDESGAHLVFSRRWEEILAPSGVDLGRPGARKPEVLRALREQGADLETTVAASWREETTVGEVLERYANRTHSSDWRIPDEVFGDAIRDLREWADEGYPSAETPLADEITLSLTVARGWAAGDATRFSGCKEGN